MAKTKSWTDYDTIECADGEIIDMNKLLEEQELARTVIYSKLPGFGGILAKLHFVYTFQVKTQATDGYYIFVNPQFTAHLSFEQKYFVMLHEIMHVLLNHLRRIQVAGFELRRANVATDYEVNDTLSVSGIVSDNIMKKTGALLDHKWDNLPFEEIYSHVSPPEDTQEVEPPKKITHSSDYKRGWEQAIKDYRAGKLKL